MLTIAGIEFGIEDYARAVADDAADVVKDTRIGVRQGHILAVGDAAGLLGLVLYNHACCRCHVVIIAVAVGSTFPTSNKHPMFFPIITTSIVFDDADGGRGKIAIGQRCCGVGLRKAYHATAFVAVFIAVGDAASERTAGEGKGFAFIHAPHKATSIDVRVVA